MRGCRNSSTRSASRRRSAATKGAEGSLVPAASEEEQEAVALALVAGEDVALPEAVLHLQEDGLDLRAQALVGGAAEAALDVGEGRQVHEDGPQAAVLAQQQADLVVQVPERGERHRTSILRLPERVLQSCPVGPESPPGLPDGR